MSQPTTGCFGNLMKILATFLAILFVLILPFNLLAFDMAHVIFSPEILSEALTANLVDSEMINDMVAGFLLSSEWLQEISPEGMDMARLLENLTPAERERIIEILMPLEWVEGQISATVKEIITWIDDDRPLPHILIDMQPVKEQLLRGGAEEMIDMIVDSWPSCLPEQVEDMGQLSLRGKEIPIFFCEPPEPFRSQMIGFATSQMHQLMREIPSELPLGGEKINPEDAVNINAMKEWIRLVRALSQSSWLLPVAFLGLIMALVVRSWRELTRWWGIPLLLSGIATFGLVVLVSTLGERLVPRLLSDLKAEAEAVYGILMMVLGSIMDVVIGGLMFHVILVSGMGLVLLVMGWFINRRVSSTPVEKPSVTPPSMVRASISEPVSPSQPIPPPPPVSPMYSDETVVEE